MLSGDEISPFIVFRPTRWWKSPSWLVPLAEFSLAVLVLTLIAWPLAALARRRYRRHLPAARPGPVSLPLGPHCGPGSAAPAGRLDLADPADEHGGLGAHLEERSLALAAPAARPRGVPGRGRRGALECPAGPERQAAVELKLWSGLLVLATVTLLYIARGVQAHRVRHQLSDGDGSMRCHPERSEGEPRMTARALRCAQHDALAVLLALSAACASPTSSPQPTPSGTEYDLVIRNGRVLDGAGNPWVRADVGISKGRIAKLGLVTGKGRREIDATRPLRLTRLDRHDGPLGRVLLESPAAENKLRMGVTTLIGGEGGTPVPAESISIYFSRLERQGIAVNFGSYYSAAQARVHVMGDGAGTPTPAQLAKMKSDVTLAMQAGALGISSALIYPPDSYQSTADLIELAKVVSPCGGFYATHMRDESENLVSGIREAVEIGEKGGVKVEIFHLKAAFAPGWGRLMPQALAEIDSARGRGVDVAADLYPYPAGGTGLSITVPNWVFAEGEEKGYARLRDPAVRERLKREVAAGSQPGWSNLVQASGGWDRVVLANPFNKKYAAYHMKSIAAIATALGRDPADVAWDIVLDALPNRAMALFFMMDERDIESALRQTVDQHRQRRGVGRRSSARSMRSACRTRGPTAPSPGSSPSTYGSGTADAGGGGAGR